MLWTYVISDLNGGEIVGTLYEKESQKTNQKEFRVEIKVENPVSIRKGDKLNIKWKYYNNFFNSWIDQK